MKDLITQLQEECEYDPEGEGSVDDLIGYKDALEDLVYRVDAIMLANSGHPDAVRFRNREGLSYMSAADVTGALFGMGFGTAPSEKKEQA